MITEEGLFGPRTADFFAQLATHNTRAWFTSHRREYEDAVRIPLERLAERAEPSYGPSHVFRPNRDVRFGRDKTPYKLNGSMWAGDVGGVYLEVSENGLSVGGGLYEPSRDQRARAREAIDADGPAAVELERIVRRLTRAGFAFAGPGLATAPRGYSRDHPRIELLRMQHYAALLALPLDSDISAVLGAWSSVRPLIEWVRTMIGADGARP